MARRTPATAEATLTSVLSRLRRVLPEGTLEGRAQLSLNVNRVDIETLESDPRAGLEILAQPLLPEFDDDWVLERRRALRATELELLERVAREGDEDAARRLVALDPLRESGVGLLMEALAAGGDVAQALQVYERLRVGLRDELGTVPAAHLRELAEHLLIQQRAPGAGPAAGRA